MLSFDFFYLRHLNPTGTESFWSDSYLNVPNFFYEWYPLLILYAKDELISNGS